MQHAKHALRLGLIVAVGACAATLLVCVTAVVYVLAAQPKWVDWPDGSRLTCDSPGVDWTILPTQDPRVTMSHVRLGWPFRAVARDSEHVEPPPPPGVVRIRPACTDSHELTRNILAYRPLWPGFLADFLFFAVSLLVIRCISRATRSGLRRRRYSCECCGYSLRGINGKVCPECGFQSRG